MTTYVILLNGDESVWETATPERRAEIFGMHEEFSRALAERGHKVVGGAELTHSRTAKRVAKDAAGVVVSDGPYAETVEQLGGFYVVESDDLEDLLQICGILAGTGDAVEVRATVDHSAAEA